MAFSLEMGEVKTKHGRKKRVQHPRAFLFTSLLMIDLSTGLRWKKRGIN